MVALTQARNTPTRSNDEYGFPVAAGVIIYAGSLVMIQAGETAVTPAGEAKDHTTTAVIVGVAKATVDNRNGLAGAETVVCSKAGAFFFDDAGDITQSDVNSTPVYAKDDQTLTAAADNGEDSTDKRAYPFAGYVSQVTADGVWLAIGH